MKSSLDANVRYLSALRQQMAPGRKLLAVMLVEHFGDIIACEPVIRHLRRENQRDHLVWILRREYKDLLSEHLQLDAVVQVTCLTEALHLAQSPHIDRLVDLHVNFRLCSWLGTVHRKTTGDPSITVENYYNYGTLLKSFCRSAGLPALEDGPRLYLPVSTQAEVNELLPRDPYYVLHVRSNELARDWTSEKWRALFDEIPAAVHGSCVEVGFQSQVARSFPAIINLCGRLTLAQLAEVIRRSSGFIGVDSGPAHVANAFERPSVILLGRYRNFDRYMPYTGYLRDHANEMLVRCDGPASEIPVAVVAKHVRRLLRLSELPADPQLGGSET